MLTRLPGSQAACIRSRVQSGRTLLRHRRRRRVAARLRCQGGSFPQLAKRIVLTIPDRRGKSVGRGTLAQRSPVSSRLIGSKPGTSTEWRWPSSPTKLVWLTLRECLSSNRLHTTLSPGPTPVLLIMHVLRYCTSPVVLPAIPALSVRYLLCYLRYP